MSDRQLTALPPEGLDAEEPPGRIEPRTQVLLIGAFCAVVLASLTALFPVKYAILDPGPVLNTLGTLNRKPLISITGRTTYPTTRGQLDLTTVSVIGGPGQRIILPQLVWAWLSRSSEVLPQEAIFAPGVTQKQTDEQNRAEMVTSQESATAAALTTLGIRVPTRLTVAGLEKGAPAAAVLKKGDVIRQIDGRPIADLSALHSVLQGVGPDHSVRVQVLRAGASLDLRTRTLASGSAVLGVLIDPSFSFPFSVKIEIENIGGPSAGMMFALGIIDTLTPGDLTGGKHIAGTGTIDPDGTVGPIGGIQEKVIGARRAGARYFLAPADDCAEVHGHVPSGLRVVKVSTLKEARAAVTAIAAGQVATLPSC